MTPEYVRRDEFGAALQAILISIGGLAQRFDKLEQRFGDVETRFDAVEGRLNTIETRLTDIESFQKTLLDTYQTTTQSILTQMAESHAQVMEQINDLKRQGN